MTVTDKNLSHAVNNGYPPPSGNIHDIRVPVPGTSASDFEVKDTGKKKKGDNENVNWNLQVWYINCQQKLAQLINRMEGEGDILSERVLDVQQPYCLWNVADYVWRLLTNYSIGPFGCCF